MLKRLELSNKEIINLCKYSKKESRHAYLFLSRPEYIKNL